MKIGGHMINVILRFAVGLLSVLLVIQIANRFRMRLDMTEEKRYSISAPTKELLGRLESDVLIEVYLAGDMPSNFVRFQKAIRETMDEFSIYTDADFNYKFIDPAQAESQRARNQFFQGLITQGIEPSNINYSGEGRTTQKLLFPGAILSYQGEELAVNFLQGDRTSGVEEMINQAIEGVEYKLANALQQLAGTGRKRIGMINGHHEPDTLQLAALTNLILSKYDLFRVNLPERLTPISGYDLLLITRPTSAFSEREKYLLDQYIMKGGKVAFFMDALRINIDSALAGSSVALPYETNLTDLFFRYGIRINPNYVADLNCGELPVVTGNYGDQPQITMLSWPYFPLISNYSDHPAVRNMDAVLIKFGSTIDTVKALGIRKYPILYTSARSKIIGTPVEVSLNDLRTELTPDRFLSGPHPVGYVLEGPFTSLYRNRFPPDGFPRSEMIEVGIPGKLVVVADGNLVMNELNPEDGKPLALGVEPFSQSTYANEALVMNLIDYLLDEEGLIVARTKEIEIRPLDKVQIREERFLWQMINLILPIGVLVLFGLLKMVWRRRKNSF